MYTCPHGSDRINDTALRSTRCEPFKTALLDENTESSEQTFRSLSRFKVLLRPMTRAHYNFVVLRMIERHNLRVVEEAAAMAARRKA